jgi:hypothetical protein
LISNGPAVATLANSQSRGLIEIASVGRRIRTKSATADSESTSNGANGFSE